MKSRVMMSNCLFMNRQETKRERNALDHRIEVDYYYEGCGSFVKKSISFGSVIDIKVNDYEKIGYNQLNGNEFVFRRKSECFFLPVVDHCGERILYRIRVFAHDFFGRNSSLEELSVEYLYWFLVKEGLVFNEEELLLGLNLAKDNSIG